MHKNQHLVTKRKRLFIDIETSPNIGMFWEAGYKKSISYENIIHERKIICICYKWEGEREVKSLAWDNRQNDRKMLQEFSKIAMEADEIVAHNGDKFDIKWFKTRMLYHRIPFPPSIITIDTLKIARKHFKFNSNKLNYISKFLGFGGKLSTKYDWWIKITLKNDRKYLEMMVRYCKRDVKELEHVFQEFRPYILSSTHYGVIFGAHKYSCPECGSDDVIKYGKRVTPTGMVKQKIMCKTCGVFRVMSEPKTKK